MNALTTNPLLANIWDWFRPGASTFADDVDSLFTFITVICIVFFVLIMVLMGLFVLWYRARPGHKEEHSPHHNNILELLWSVIPLLLVIVIFYKGFVGYLGMQNAPADAYEIQVIAKKWNWTFVYPNGVIDPNLHLPKGKNVKLVMESQDVLHSLFIPAFRVKMDCVPGKYTTMWFNANRISPGATVDDSGGYELFCTEYCGTGHSTMMSRVFVYDEEDFDAKLRELGNVRLKKPVVVGEKLYRNRGCAQCHSIEAGGDRPANGGPSFKGYFGTEVAWSKVTSGPMKGPMDENYIRESILNPMAKIRAGYRPIMPSYQGQLSNDEIFALIQYIKSLNGVGPEDWQPLEGEEGAEGDSAPESGEADSDSADSDGSETGEADSEESVDEATDDTGAGEEG